MVFSKLFAENTICLATSLKLGGYVYVFYKNWDNYETNSNIVIVYEEYKENKENNNKFENMKRSLNNLYALYDVYNLRF